MTRQVHFIDKTKNTAWTNSKLESDCNKEELEQYNLRRLFHNEVVLDLEDKSQLEIIEETLKEKNAQFQIWDTGSRGYHIHMTFPDLEKFDYEIRKKFRQHLIKLFGADTALSSENQWLAVENRPHFKTGKIKTLVREKSGFNKIDEEIINKIETWYETTSDTRKELRKEFKFNVDREPFLKYALENQITNGERDMVLFKNLVALLVSAGKNVDEIKEIGTKVVANCPGKTISEWMGWIKSGCEEYNPHELRLWALRHKLPVLEHSFDKNWLEAVNLYSELEDIDCSEDFSDMSKDARDLVSEDDARTEYIVDELIEKNAFTIFGGDGGSTKSFFALIVAIHALSEKPLFYKEARAKKVIYVDEENGAKVLRKRIKYYCEGLGIEVPEGLKIIGFKDIKIVDGNYNFERLKRLVKKEKPDLVILDSLVRLLVGDENSVKDVRVMFDNLKHLKELTTLIALHHANKPGENNRKNRFDKTHLRGSSDFVNAPEAVIEFLKDDSSNDFELKTIELKVVKDRNTCLFEDIASYRLKGRIKDQEPVTLEFLGFNEKSVSAIDKARSKIIELFSDQPKELSFKEIKEMTGLAKESCREALNELLSLKKVKLTGSGKNIRYRID